MAVGKLNLTILQGATFRHTLTWLQEDETPVDLTGWDARMHVRANIKAEEILLELTTDNDRIIISDPESGVIQLYISAEDTAEIPWIQGVYDLEVFQDPGVPGTDIEVVRLVAGTVKVVKEVTR